MKKILLIILISICILITGCNKTKNPKLESIIVQKKEIVLYIGSSTTIEYELFPENVIEEIIITIKDPLIATIDNGVVTGINYGNTFVILKSKNDESIIETINIKVIKRSFNVAYDLDGGYFDSDVESNYIENIGLDYLPIPIKDGYNFLGWYLDDTLVTSILPNVNKDVTLVANWEAIIDIESAELIIKQIHALPYYTTYNDKFKIKLIKEQYDKLNTETKKFVSNIDELNQKILEIEKIENNKSEITYVLGDNIYLSKEELFINFYSDFYKYIITYHGDEYLKDNSVININSLEEFVELARSFNGAGYSNLYGIGHLAGRYMLIKDLNGILENQPETGFFGYCYKNGLYKDLLPFFIRFFAYWRIDEKYANESNYGADIFAEGWAPTVDIAKFFYYDQDNLPSKALKTERMFDCFSNISSVVYGKLPTTPINGMILPTDLKLRGYVFDGWYDNPEFSGDKITTITDLSKKIILYAKWSKDTSLIDKDNSELVDVYIYNLTTSPANLCKQTVKYVRDMYDNLSINGKSLVKNYNTLLHYEEIFADYFLQPVTINVTTKIDGEFDLNAIRDDFIIDFNITTNSNLQSIDELISGKYSYMKKIGQFFKNSAMRSKWIYLLNILYEEGCFPGLEIQINRIKDNGNGDLEYVTMAIAELLCGNDATSNVEILVDYSTMEKINQVINSFGTYQMIFEKAVSLPIINISGYKFVGFFDNNNNIITKVTIDVETELVAVYIKK